MEGEGGSGGGASVPVAPGVGGPIPDPEPRPKPSSRPSGTTRSPIVAGVGAVFSGQLPAADAVSVLGVRPPRYLFYMLSGALCDVVQLALDLGLHNGLGVRDPSVCWAVTFALSVVARHTSHRYLVFGRYVGGYWRSLIRMYGGYSVIIILSTLFNWAVTSLAGLAHYVAWVITLLWTGVANYFILKKLWSFGGSKAGGGGGKDKAEDETGTGRRPPGMMAAHDAELEDGRGVVPLGRGKEALTSRRAVVI